MATSVKEIEVIQCGPVLPWDTIKACMMRPPFHTQSLNWFNSHLTKPKALRTFVKNLTAGLRELEPADREQLMPLLGTFLELPPRSVDSITSAIARASAQPPRLGALLEDHRSLLHSSEDLAYLQLRVLCAMQDPTLCCSTIDEASADPREGENGWIRRPRDKAEVERDQAVAKCRRVASRLESPK
jgi:hypothetical protein